VGRLEWHWEKWSSAGRGRRQGSRGDVKMSRVSVKASGSGGGRGRCWSLQREGEQIQWRIDVDGAEPESKRIKAGDTD
jgi:hypothetical protein